MARKVMHGPRVVIPPSNRAVVGCDCDPCKDDKGPPPDDTFCGPFKVALFYHTQAWNDDLGTLQDPLPGGSLRWRQSAPNNGMRPYVTADLPFAVAPGPQTISRSFSFDQTSVDAVPFSIDLTFECNGAGTTFITSVNGEPDSIFADPGGLFGTSLIPFRSIYGPSDLSGPSFQPYLISYLPGQLVGENKDLFPFVKVDISVNGNTFSYHTFAFDNLGVFGSSAIANSKRNIFSTGWLTPQQHDLDRIPFSGGLIEYFGAHSINMLGGPWPTSIEWPREWTFGRPVQIGTVSDLYKDRLTTDVESPFIVTESFTEFRLFAARDWLFTRFSSADPGADEDTWFDGELNNDSIAVTGGISQSEVHRGPPLNANNPVVVLQRTEINPPAFFGDPMPELDIEITLTGQTDLP